MQNSKKACNQVILKTRVPAGVKDLMEVYKRFQEANAVTEQYLQIISPEVHESNSNQSFMTESK